MSLTSPLSFLRLFKDYYNTYHAILGIEAVWGNPIPFQSCYHTRGLTNACFAIS